MSLQRKLDYSLNPQYTTREERNLFAASLLRSYQGHKSVLNIGSGGERFLKKTAEEFDITDIDIQGDVDHRLNLETDLPLPFEDNQFDSVICLDVLEHINTLHDVFAEINRVTSKYIFISLPNPLHEYLFNVVKGRNYTTDPEKRKEFGSLSKYYGIPLEKPDDRHKWFFGFEEAYDYFALNADKYGYEVDKVFFPRRDTLLKSFIKATHFKFYINFVPRSFWIVLKKK